MQSNYTNDHIDSMDCLWDRGCRVALLLYIHIYFKTPVFSRKSKVLSYYVNHHFITFPPKYLQVVFL